MMRRRGWFWVWVALAAGVLLALPCGHLNEGDGYYKFAQAKALFFHHTVGVPRELCIGPEGRNWFDSGDMPARDGRAYIKYGIGQSVVWLVPIATAWRLHGALQVDFDTLAQFGVSLVNPLILLLTCASLAGLLGAMGCGPRWRAGTVAAYLFGTSALPYANTACSEPLCGFLVLWAVAWPVMRPSLRAAAGAGVLVSAAALVKTEMIALLPLCLWLALRGERWAGRLAAFLVGSAPGAVWILVGNRILRGHALAFSYGEESSRFTSPMAGLAGYFLSVDKNVLLFNPGLLLAALGWRAAGDHHGPRVMRPAVIGLWAVFTVFYASWWMWDGGLCFGPRFLQPLMPVTMLAAGAVVERAWPARQCAVAPHGSASATLALGLVVAWGLPIQMAGSCVKSAQAARVAEAVGLGQLQAQVRLLALKLRRGPGAPEFYRATDFAVTDTRDACIDQRNQSRFRYLNHWWAMSLAGRARPAGQEGGG